MIIMLDWSNYGRKYTTEIVYDDDMQAEFQADSVMYLQRLDDENHGRMRVQQSTPSIAAYKRALRAKLGLRGAALERAARVAAKYGNANAVLRAAAGF
jgi:hypothetical protein